MGKIPELGDNFMNMERIATLLEKPEVQKKILKDYHGGYSIGLAANPQDHNRIVIRLRIEGEHFNIPSQVILEGETIPILVTHGFQLPAPLSV
jgi:hypothetical protein